MANKNVIVVDPGAAAILECVKQIAPDLIDKEIYHSELYKWVGRRLYNVNGSKYYPLVSMGNITQPGGRCDFRKKVNIRLGLTEVKNYQGSFDIGFCPADYYDKFRNWVAQKRTADPNWMPIQFKQWMAETIIKKAIHETLNHAGLWGIRDDAAIVNGTQSGYAYANGLFFDFYNIYNGTVYGGDTGATIVETGALTPDTILTAVEAFNQQVPKNLRLKYEQSKGSGLEANSRPILYMPADKVEMFCLAWLDKYGSANGIGLLTPNSADNKPLSLMSNDMVTAGLKSIIQICPSCDLEGNTMIMTCKDNNYMAEDDFIKQIKSVETQKIGRQICMWGDYEFAAGVFCADKDTIVMNEYPPNPYTHNRGDEAIEMVDPWLEVIANQ